MTLDTFQVAVISAILMFTPFFLSLIKTEYRVCIHSICHIRSFIFFYFAA